jgi:hypothetical protein
VQPQSLKNVSHSSNVDLLFEKTTSTLATAVKTPNSAPKHAKVLIETVCFSAINVLHKAASKFLVEYSPLVEHNLRPKMGVHFNGNTRGRRVDTKVCQEI